MQNYQSRIVWYRLSLVSLVIITLLLSVAYCQEHQHCLKEQRHRMTLETHCAAAQNKIDRWEAFARQLRDDRTVWPIRSCFGGYIPGTYMTNGLARDPISEVEYDQLAFDWKNPDDLTKRLLPHLKNEKIDRLRTVTDKYAAEVERNIYKKRIQHAMRINLSHREIQDIEFFEQQKEEIRQAIADHVFDR